MDLNSVREIHEPSEWSDLPPWQRGWAWMAGGTWLFSEKQPDIKGLVSLRNLNWSELTVDREGGHLVIGASCRLGDIRDYPWPEDLTAGAAFRLAVEALAASWKVADVATVGGNLCLALPFGTMAPLMIALDARYELWDQAGTIRHLPACRFQRGNRDTVLDRGEVLRRVLIPLEELQARASYFRFGNTASDPALVIACGVTNSRRRDLRIAVGGAFNAPLRFDFEHFPSEEEILSRVHRECPLDRYINDYRGGAQYRKHLLSTLLLRLREDLA